MKPHAQDILGIITAYRHPAVRARTPANARQHIEASKMQIKTIVRGKEGSSTSTRLISRKQLRASKCSAAMSKPQHIMKQAKC